LDRSQAFGALVLITTFSALVSWALFFHVYSIVLPESLALPIAVVVAVVVVVLSWIAWSKITRCMWAIVTKRNYVLPRNWAYGLCLSTGLELYEVGGQISPYELSQR
jgi:hypothetical protein